MKTISKQVSALLLAFSSASVSFGQIVVATAYIEYNTVFAYPKSAGVSVNPGDSINGSLVNAFYSFVPTTISGGNSLEGLSITFQDATTGVDSAIATFGLFNWTPMVDLSTDFPGQLAWGLGITDQPNPWSAQQPVNTRLVMAFMNADSPELLSAQSQVGVVAATWYPESDIDSYQASFVFAGGLQVLLGDAGSVGMAPIPEPRVYAAIFGLAALGLVVWRRRVRR